MNDTFEKNPRRIQELAGRPIADKIYKDIFGQDTIIDRTEQPDSFTLDKYFAIDVKLTLATKQILLGQEKFLSQKEAKYRTITVEYYQNPIDKEPGDWFKLASQFYFVGYFNINKTGFDPWVLADWLQIVLNTYQSNIFWLDQDNKWSNAKASFRHTKMENLPKSCIISCSWDIKKFIN